MQMTLFDQKGLKMPYYSWKGVDLQARWAKGALFRDQRKS